MNKIVLDSDTISKLGAGGQLEICDTSGRTFGFFVPAGGKKVSLQDWAAMLFTDEELENARNEPGGKTTQEVLERLKRR